MRKQAKREPPMASTAIPSLEPADDGVLPPLAYPYRAPRLRTCLIGKLVQEQSAFLPPHVLALDCSIRDLSEGGAKIILKQFQLLQPELYLIVVKFCVAYQARVVWRKFPARGLKFSKTYFLNAPQPETSNTLRRLWLEFRSAPDKTSD